jgi:lipoprotein signal peptidase
VKVQVTKIKTFTIWFTIVILGLLTLNNSLFLHVHKLDSGTYISHAHPFNKSDTTNNGTGHSHTKNEIYIYQILNNLVFVFLVIFSYQLIVLLNKFKGEKVTELFIYSNEISVFKTRPPPIFA